MKPYAHFDPVVMAWLLAVAIAFLFALVAILAFELHETRQKLIDLVEALYGQGAPMGWRWHFKAGTLYKSPGPPRRFPSKWVPW